MPTPNPCIPERLAEAYRYANLLPTPEHRYASDYIVWLCSGVVGYEPKRGPRLSRARAFEVRAHIDSMKLWGD